MSTSNQLEETNTTAATSAALITEQPPAQPAPVKKSLLKDALRGSGFYSIGVFAARLASIVLLPLYTRYLSPSDYGVLELLDLTFNVFGMVFGASYSEALYFHYNEASTEKVRQQVIRTTLAGSAFLGLVGGLTGLLLAGPLSSLLFSTAEYKTAMQIMSLNFALQLPMEACLAWLRAINRADLYVAATVSRLIVAITLNVVFLVVLGMKVTGVLMGTMTTSALFATILVICCIRSTSGSILLPLVRRLFRYSLLVTGTGSALFIMHYVDRFFLQRYVSLADIGIYSLAYKIGMVVSQVHASFHSYWTTQMYWIVRREDGAVLFGRIFTYLVLGLVACGLGLTLFSGPVLMVFAAPEFLVARQLVPWVAAAYVLRGIGDHFRCIFYIENIVGKDVKVTWMGAMVAMIAYATLIPRFHYWGAIAATILAFGTNTGLAFFWGRKSRVLHLEIGRLAKIIGAAALALTVSGLVTQSGLINELLIRSGIFALFIAVLWLTGFFQAIEIDLAKKALGKLSKYVGYNSGLTCEG